MATFPSPASPLPPSSTGGGSSIAASPTASISTREAMMGTPIATTRTAAMFASPAAAPTALTANHTTPGKLLDGETADPFCDIDLEGIMGDGVDMQVAEDEFESTIITTLMEQTSSQFGQQMVQATAALSVNGETTIPTPPPTPPQFYNNRMINMHNTVPSPITTASVAATIAMAPVNDGAAYGGHGDEEREAAEATVAAVLLLPSIPEVTFTTAAAARGGGGTPAVTTTSTARRSFETFPASTTAAPATVPLPPAAFEEAVTSKKKAAAPPSASVPQFDPLPPSPLATPSTTATTTNSATAAPVPTSAAAAVAAPVPSTHNTTTITATTSCTFGDDDDPQIVQQPQPSKICPPPPPPPPQTHTELLRELQSDESDEESVAPPKKKHKKRRSIATVCAASSSLYADAELAVDQTTYSQNDPNKNKNNNNNKGENKVATANATATTTAAAADTTCQRCGRQFNTFQGRNAHLQFCVGNNTDDATATTTTAVTARETTTTTTMTTATAAAAAIPKEVQDNLGSYWTGTRTTTTTATSSTMTYPRGTLIRKRFDDGQYYRGTIIGYDPIEHYYQIQYEDGDAEDFTTAEVKRYRMKTQPNTKMRPTVSTAPSRNKKRGRGRPRSTSPKNKKPKRATTTTGDEGPPSQPPHVQGTTEATVNGTEAEANNWFVVEEFRGRRWNSDTKQEEYLIKWKNFPEAKNTWELYASLDPVIQQEAQLWYKEYKEEKKTSKIRALKRQEDMKRLGLLDDDDDDDNIDENADNDNNTMLLDNRNKTKKSPSKKNVDDAIKNKRYVEDTTWEWNDVSQITYRTVQRVDVNEPNCRQLVTDARINGTPVVLTGHPGWANFTKRWMRRRCRGDSPDPNSLSSVTPSIPSPNEITNSVTTTFPTTGDTDTAVRAATAAAVPESTPSSTATASNIHAAASATTDTISVKDETVSTKVSSASALPDSKNSKMVPLDTENSSTTNEIPAVHLTEATTASITPTSSEQDSFVEKIHTPNVIGSTTDYHDGSIEGDTDLLDLSDPSWYLDVKSMADDIGNEEVPVVKRNYDAAKPISGNILASKFFEAAWSDDPTAPPATGKKPKKPTSLYLHQWQFPLSESACRKFCHKNVPLPNHILGEDLLKYWLDRVKLDSPLQYIFMGKADTMSKLHKDAGGLAISIAPITGEKECVLVHRDDGPACLYHTTASVDPDEIDLDAYPLLPYARIWKTSIVPGEILLMPHGTYHQCRNLLPCLSYSRFHLDVINLRAFLQSLFDGDAPELRQDEVLWNATQELIQVIEKATDEKRQVDPQLIDAVDALIALRNITREITRKLHVRQTVKGISSTNSTSLLSSVKIDGDAEIWQKLVEDIDNTLHEFRYRFNKKLPSFRRKRLRGKKILALPAMAFQGKAKPAEIKGQNNEPVIAFECPVDRGYLSLPAVPSKVRTDDEQKAVMDDIELVVAGDTVQLRIEGRQCSATVKEIRDDIHAAYVSFEDLPALYNDYMPCDLIRIPSVGGGGLVEPLLEDIKPGKLMIGLIGKDEYRAIIQHVKRGKLFKCELDFGNGYTVDRLVDTNSILSVVSLNCRKNDADPTSTHMRIEQSDDGEVSVTDENKK